MDQAFFDGKEHGTALWYDAPANSWNEALPLGNGRLGAMVFGGIGGEHLQVNEESIWYGGPMDRNNPDAKRKLPIIRKLIMEGRIHEAERLCVQALGGTPQGMRIYQTLGDLDIRYDFGKEVGLGDVTQYERGLDVSRAVAYVHFCHEGTDYGREIFLSAPDDVCVMHLTAKGRKKLCLDVMQTRHHLYDYSRKAAEDAIVLGGNLGADGISYAMMCKAKVADGTVEVIGETISINDASEAWLYWSAATTYRVKAEGQALERQALGGQALAGQAAEGQASGGQAFAGQAVKEQALSAALARALDHACQVGYEELKARHVADYQSYFNRMSLDLCGCASENGNGNIDVEDLDNIPTDRRLARVAAGEEDLALEQLYFDFGRYLLISCSRPGTLPATLQGLWNQDIEAPWDSKYTININTEMNYWCAEPCGLGDCHLPLFDLMKKMLPNGQKTAREMYGCRGFVAHHNTDIWGDTAPQDLWVPGSFWVMGGAWLCTHIWMHYEYTGDKDFLEEMFPMMREAALFFLDFLVEYEVDGEKYLGTCPSVSPENTFVLPNGEQGSNSIGVTMDNQILRDLFTQCNKAAKALGVSDELDKQISEACAHLLPTRIASDGRIMEWREEYGEKEPGHRHISHLYGLHPSTQITVDGTPELAAAARRTLEKRLENGGGHTGWSRAWIMNHYAKLWDGEAAHENLRQLLVKSTLPNLLDNHPPFQIDGNFGAVAAMAEMLAQSDENRIVLLPALPKAWANGSVRGLRVRQNAKLDITWRDSRLESAWICSGADCTRRIVYDGKSVELELEKGKDTEIRFG